MSKVLAELHVNVEGSEHKINLQISAMIDIPAYTGDQLPECAAGEPFLVGNPNIRYITDEPSRIIDYRGKVTVSSRTFTCAVSSSIETITGSGDEGLEIFDHLVGPAVAAIRQKASGQLAQTEGGLAIEEVELEWADLTRIEKLLREFSESTQMARNS